ncbi:hypothetical protein CLF_109227 [Clonorchis sinensis]|uniref:Uncharacterized protein n=1 Tax=Clonorchis sinensis TaxID=79923 RepID=G7YJ31_CLOSI|nr:hypothetical protein CLF_109227 [Clonorchis sinensis]
MDELIDFTLIGQIHGSSQNQSKELRQFSVNHPSFTGCECEVNILRAIINRHRFHPVSSWPIYRVISMFKSALINVEKVTNAGKRLTEDNATAIFRTSECESVPHKGRLTFQLVRYGHITVNFLDGTRLPRPPRQSTTGFAPLRIHEGHRKSSDGHAKESMRPRTNMHYRVDIRLLTCLLQDGLPLGVSANK